MALGRSRRLRPVPNAMLPPHTWHSWVGHPGPTLRPICYPPLCCTIKYPASRVSVSLLSPDRASPSLPGFTLSFPGFHLFAPCHSSPLRRSPLLLPPGRSSLPSTQLLLLRYWFCSDYAFPFFLLAVRWRLHHFILPPGKKRVLTLQHCGEGGGLFDQVLACEESCRGRWPRSVLS